MSDIPKFHLRDLPLTPNLKFINMLPHPPRPRSTYDPGKFDPRWSTRATIAFDDEYDSICSTETKEEGPSTLQKWNSPRINTYRFLTTLYSFFTMGINDGALGALIPYITAHYHLPYISLSTLFFSPFIGYVLASLTNSTLHHRHGQFGIASLSPLLRLAGFIPLAFHPPFAVLPFVMIFPGYAAGLQDSAWNAWIGNMHNANELLGFLHGAYGLGACVGPLAATAMITRLGWPWWRWYWIPIGLAVSEGLVTPAAFWTADGRAYRLQLRQQSSGKRVTTRHVLREPVTWLIALFMVGYVGVEVSLGGWIVTFMLVVRQADPFTAGLTSTIFWLGLTVGRVVLGFVTGRVGEKRAITTYLLISIVVQTLYWLVPSFVASAVFVAFLGFFLGPMFPASVVAATKLLPSECHVSAIGFAAALGGGGAALFPFAVGAIAQNRGVEVLQPVVLAILVFILGTWWLIPGGLRRGGLERARENKEPVCRHVRGILNWLRMKAGKGA